MMTTTTMKVAATSLLSLLAATATIAIAAEQEGLLNFRAARGMGGGLVKFMMTTETRKTTVQAVKYCFTTHKKNKKPKTCEGERTRRKREAISVEAIGATDRDVELLRRVIRPSTTLKSKDDNSSNAISVSGGSEEFSPSRRQPRFLYMVTKTQTEYRTRFTDTLSITFKCTPSKPFIPICGDFDDEKYAKRNRGLYLGPKSHNTRGQRYQLPLTYDQQTEPKRIWFWRKK